MRKRIWRKVVGYSRYRYYKAHGDTILLKLECGHEVGVRLLNVIQLIQRRLSVNNAN